MPMVDATVLIAVIVCGDQKFVGLQREEQDDGEETDAPASSSTARSSSESVAETLPRLTAAKPRRRSPQ